MFLRFFDEGLAQASYLLACTRTRRAVVIDPRRDIEEYLGVAAGQGLTITHAIETHVHADFVSGARELAALGADVVSGPGAWLRFDHDERGDGDVLHIGDVQLTFLHTPGHTPEHISILAREPGEAARVFTGDTLFVGAVGRPDLLGEAVAHQLAQDLHQSLFGKLLTLDDDVEVHPAHGAGSLCGAGIGSASLSTIGHERRRNPLLQYRSRDEFVTAVLGDLPETPPYFARMKRVNRDGPPVLGLSTVALPPLITPAAAADRIAAGAWMLDVRPAVEYGRGHVPGAINLGPGAKLGYWAGWIVPEDARVILMLDGGPRHAAEVRRQLLRVGLDAIEGMVDGGFAGWRAASLPVHTLQQISAIELRTRVSHPSSMTLLDVRSPQEWKAGHIPGAVHMPVGEIASRVHEIPRGTLVATLCEGGYRSALAASLLERYGFASVANVTEGMGAWRALEAAPR